MPAQGLSLPKKQVESAQDFADAEHLGAFSNPENAEQKSENIFAVNPYLKEKLKKRKQESDLRASHLKAIINQKNIASVIAQVSARVATKEKEVVQAAWH